jgi:three-Cys-motif partner protein
MTKQKNKYLWSDDVSKAPEIEAHTKIKHSIIKDYISSYLRVIANPLTAHIKLSIIDGFCGGGLYSINRNTPHYGTPVIILETLRNTIADILANRAANNITRELSFECDVYFVDKDINAIECLKKVVAPYLVLDSGLPLKINSQFINAEFGAVYKTILSEVGKSKAIFILDPCGYSETPLPVIREIMHGAGYKREVIWTFMIDSMKAYATDNSKALINAGYNGILNLFSGNDEPTGFCVQKEIFNTVKNNIGVPFFTPFAIKQKIGWNYWLIHLAWHHRASEVMKEVEHRHADEREHYGGSALNMMAAAGDSAYLFGNDDVKRGREELFESLPQLLARPEFNDGISFNDFMHKTYNETPLVSDVIKHTLVNHDDIEIHTPVGGNRSSAKRIKTGDIIKLKKQTRFIFSSTKFK